MKNIPLRMYKSKKGLAKTVTTIFFIGILLLVITLKFNYAYGEYEFGLTLDKEYYCNNETLGFDLYIPEGEVSLVEIDCLDYKIEISSGRYYIILSDLSFGNSDEITCNIVSNLKDTVYEKTFHVRKCVEAENDNKSDIDVEDVEDSIEHNNKSDNIDLENIIEINLSKSTYNINDTLEGYIIYRCNTTDQKINISILSPSGLIETYNIDGLNNTPLPQFIMKETGNYTLSVLSPCKNISITFEVSSKSNNTEELSNTLEESIGNQSDIINLSQVNESIEIVKHIISTKQGNYEIISSSKGLKVISEKNNIVILDVDKSIYEANPKIQVKLPFEFDNNIHLYIWRKEDKSFKPINYDKISRNELALFLEDTPESIVSDDKDIEEEVNVNITEKKYEIILPTKPLFEAIIENNGNKESKVRVKENGIEKEFSIILNKGILNLKLVDPENLVLAKRELKKYTFPYKMLKLNITNLSYGEEIEIIFNYPLEIIENAKIIKFDPITNKVYDVPFEKIDDNKIKVKMVDGGELDEDKEINGIIIDDIGIELSEIVNISLNPENIGYGINVTIRAVLESIYNLEYVRINITSPSGETTSDNMTFCCNGLSGWSYVRSILINNSASENLTNYQIMVNLNTSGLIAAGKMRTDCNDIRFTDSDGVTLLNFWIESGCNTANTTIWVRVPHIQANSIKRIYLYYGNASATNQSNGSLVFDFFDDFIGTSLNTSRWVAYSSNYGVSGGNIEIKSGGIELVNPLPFRFQDGYISETRISHTTTAGNYGGVLPSVSSSPFTNASNANSSATIILMRNDGSTTVYYWIGSGNSASFDVANGVTTGWSIANNVWNITGISVRGGDVRLWRGRQVIVTITGINWAKNLTYVKLGSYHRSNSYNLQDTLYDWILVRKYTEPEPVTNINSEINASQLRIYQYNYSDTWVSGLYNYSVEARNVLGDTSISYNNFTVSINATIYSNTTNTTYRQDNNVSLIGTSNITNYRNEFRGFAEVYIEKNVSNSWQLVATLLNDSQTGNIRTFSNSTIFNLSNYTSQWNISANLGNFRLVSKVVNPNGQTLNSTNPLQQQLMYISYFEVIPTVLKINITAFNGSAKPEILTRIDVWNGSQLINYSFGSTETDLLLYEVYNITFERNCTGRLYTTIREVNITRRNITSQIVCNYNNSKPRGSRIVTPMFAFNSTNIIFKNSTLELPITRSPSYILHCTNWNFNNANCSSWNIIPKSNFADYYENETHIRFTTTSFMAYGGVVFPDLVVNSIQFNITNAKEFESVGVMINVSNIGDENVTEALLSLKISLWNGTSWINESTQTRYVNLSINQSMIINFTWEAKPGTWRFNATIDPNNEIVELSEENNEKIDNYTVSAWHIFFGQTDSRIVLMGAGNTNFTYWIPNAFEGTLYFADYDSYFSFSNLAPLNGTNDLEEVDLALRMTGFNDSVKKLFDKNNDGMPDHFDCFIVNTQELCNIPIINSTENNYGNFVTGILWDKGDGGNEYNGSQDIVFVTKINLDATGSYGIYDFEIRIPAYLRELKGDENRVVIYFEVGPLS